MLLDKTLIYFVRGCDETTAIVMALDMMFAGIDTSSHTSSYAMFHLAKHPEVQEKLYREIKKELPDKVKYECTYYSNLLFGCKECFLFIYKKTV